MKKILGFLFLFVMISGCSNNQPAIVKVDTPPEEASSEPELIEEVSDDEEIDEFIEFPLKDEVIRVNLSQVPILQAYLQASPNWQPIIEQMKIERLSNNTTNDIYLLEFSCYQEQCSYLLLDQSSDNSGFLIANLAQLKDAIFSPDETKLLVTFDRESTTTELPLSDAVVIDLDNWQELSLSHDVDGYNLLDYQRSFVSADWVDDETITISFPDTVKLITDDDEGNATNSVLFHIVTSG
ncbi:hypothetical protein [Ornithinibacillus contaminans]|uniref:hypothetical protein n=1 Tax=Ornithinibacillus contaminans TaxID=694055 RepID=UPI00064D98FB|nr:hypothetical protein [Ornithinibacillus contaminans]